MKILQLSRIDVIIYFSETFIFFYYYNELAYVKSEKDVIVKVRYFSTEIRNLVVLFGQETHLRICFLIFI